MRILSVLARALATALREYDVKNRTLAEAEWHIHSSPLGARSVSRFFRDFSSTQSTAFFVMNSNEGLQSDPQWSGRPMLALLTSTNHSEMQQPTWRSWLISSRRTELGHILGHNYAQKRLLVTKFGSWETV